MALVGISPPFSFTPMFPAVAPEHRQREGLIATGSCRAALDGAFRRVSPGASGTLTGLLKVTKGDEVVRLPRRPWTPSTQSQREKQREDVVA